MKAEKENRVGNAGHDRFVDIVSLTPYMSKWSIKGTEINIGLYLLMSTLGRVTQKGEMRAWNNAKGSGKLFSFTVVDKSECDLKVTAFKEDAEK